MNWFKNKISVPTGEHSTMGIAKTWRVSWTSWSDSSNTYAHSKDQIEVFLSLDDAKKFKERLIESFTLTRCGCRSVEIKENT